MSLTELKKLVPPPNKPFEVGTLDGWKQVEEKLNLRLPKDYREFIFTYGSGLFAGFYRIYNPFAKSEYTSLYKCVNTICNQDQRSQRLFPDRFPYPFYPEPNGLVPWGNDENGNDYFWLSEGPPTKWQVVQMENRGSGMKIQPFTMTGFLVNILKKKIEALAGDYPCKQDYVFEPWRPSVK